MNPEKENSPALGPSRKLRHGRLVGTFAGSDVVQEGREGIVAQE